MTKSTKQSKVVAVPVDQPDNANAVAVDPVASDYTQVKDQAEKSIENPIEPVQTVVAVGAEPVVKSKPKTRAKSKVKPVSPVFVRRSLSMVDCKPKLSRQKRRS